MFLNLISRLLAVGITLVFLPINNSLANESKVLCESVLGDKNRSLTQDSATYINNSDGQLYISKKALVYGGRPVNTNKFRAPSILKSQGQVTEKNATIFVSNFLHNEVFYDAQIPISSEAIEDVYVHTMPFPVAPGVMAGHIQARFVFRKGHEIEVFDSATKKSQGFVKDMIISYEAALPPDASYNFALGAVDANPLVGRLVSGSQKVHEGPNREFNQFKIKLNDAEKAQLLAHYLKHSSGIQMTEFYNTIVRNCTTTIFDGIDSLPRFQALIQDGQLSPFLTTIGGDPVIGPAVNALLERFGNDVEKVQDLKDEYKGIYQSYGTPEKVENHRMPFAPGGSSPMTLVVSTDNTEHLNAQQKQMIYNTVDNIIEELPQTINMLLSSAFVSAGDLQNSPQMIQAMTKLISKKLKARVAILNKNLPVDTPISISIQLTPFPSEKFGVDLSGQGLRAQLPFDLVQLDINDSNREEIAKVIHQGISETNNYVDENIPVFLKNFNIHMLLQKDHSRFSNQILLGFQPLLKNVKIENSQIVISQFEIPERKTTNKVFLRRMFDKIRGRNSESTQLPFMNMLISVNQSVSDEVPNHAKIRFGAQFETAQSPDSLQFLDIPRITKGRFLCWAGLLPHTPKLIGQLTASPLGNESWVKRTLNKVLKGKNVTLSVTDLDLNLSNFEIEASRVRIGVLGLRCLEMESVNKQLANEANSKMQQFIEKYGSGDVELP